MTEDHLKGDTPDKWRQNANTSQNYDAFLVIKDNTERRHLNNQSNTLSEADLLVSKLNVPSTTQGHVNSENSASNERLDRKKALKNSNS